MLFYSVHGTQGFFGIPGRRNVVFLFNDQGECFADVFVVVDNHDFLVGFVGDGRFSSHGSDFLYDDKYFMG